MFIVFFVFLFAFVSGASDALQPEPGFLFNRLRRLARSGRKSVVEVSFDTTIDELRQRAQPELGGSGVFGS